MSLVARKSDVQFDDVLGFVLALLGLIYLTFAMLRPERF